MKKQFYGFIFLTAIFLFPMGLSADNTAKSSLSTHFQWKYPGIKTADLMTPANEFELDQGFYQVRGPNELLSFGKKLLSFLTQTEKDLADLYSLQPGDQKIIIRLFSQDRGNPYNLDTLVLSSDRTQLTLPFPVMKGTEFDKQLKRFSMFQLYHAIVKVKLAFGNKQRNPISSHAYRFVDGLSGFLAMDVMSRHHPVNIDAYLQILDIHHQKSEKRSFVTQEDYQNNHRQ